MAIAGTRLDGRYTLIRPLGRGASSVVYLALGDDGKPYTAKIFHKHLQENAHREARMYLNHPNLGRTFALSEIDGHPTVIGLLIMGQPLFQFYKERPTLLHTPRSFVRTLLDLLAALIAMHRVGLLHRDIKPDNIVVNTGGRAVLVDYDLSGPIGEEFRVPVRIGTQAFQSPEAQRGEPQTPQSDLWSVGILLYWGLYGELPERDDHLEGHPHSTKDAPAQSILEHDFRAPHTQPQSLYQHLAALALKLLQVNPQQRPNSAEQTRARVIEAARADGLL